MGETDVTDDSSVVEPVEGPVDDGRGKAEPGGGRSPRAAKTRRAVVDALLALLDEGNLRPTAREVADRAGVSLRSVYVHFDDVEALFVAAAIRHHEQLEEARGKLDATGALPERLEAFVDWRATTFEFRANVRRAAMLQEPFSPALRDVMTMAHQLGQAQVEEVFGVHMADAESEHGAYQRAAVNLLGNAMSWDQLRQRQKLSVDETKGVIAKLIRTVLSAER